VPCFTENHETDINERGSARYFEVVPAVDARLLDQVYALRYHVYCIEHQFENPASFPGERETDRYDASSRHIALIYRPSGEVVGTARVVLPKLAEANLPILSITGSEVHDELRRYPFERIGEISRYVVSKGFRRRKGEAEFPDIGYSVSGAAPARRAMPHLTLELIRGIHQIAVSQQLQYLCACMRPALRRLLDQLGFHFKAIGPLVNYHGLRQPCIAAVDDLVVGFSAGPR
jgi:N-acyl amino acid synthase of PEP-CTERM/exosortase system